MKKVILGICLVIYCLCGVLMLSICFYQLFLKNYIALIGIPLSYYMIHDIEKDFKNYIKYILNE